MEEQGTYQQIVPWLVMQIMLPALLLVLLNKKRRYAYWLVAVYGAMMVLFGLGTTGWALMGLYTPLYVYVVCGLLLITGFGTVYNSLKDLNIAKQPRKTYLDEG